MLTAAYHMLKNGTFYEDLSETYFATRDHAKLAKQLVRRREDLGLAVQVTPLAA